MVKVSLAYRPGLSAFSTNKSRTRAPVCSCSFACWSLTSLPKLGCLLHCSPLHLGCRGSTMPGSLTWKGVNVWAEPLRGKVAVCGLNHPLEEEEGCSRGCAVQRARDGHLLPFMSSFLSRHPRGQKNFAQTFPQEINLLGYFYYCPIWGSSWPRRRGLRKITGSLSCSLPQASHYLCFAQ